jgi:hypothetical protein
VTTRASAVAYGELCRTELEYFPFTFACHDGSPGVYVSTDYEYHCCIVRRTLIPSTAVFIALLSAVTFVVGQNAPSTGDSDNSLGDIARKVRPKDAKVTSQRVFTEENIQHSMSQKDATPTNVSTLADSLEKARSAVRQSQGQTERQYADSVVHDIRFPGREDWEHRMYAQQLKVIASSHAVLDSVAANAPDAVIRMVKYDFYLEVITRDHLKAEGIAKAGAWERNR